MEWPLSEPHQPPQPVRSAAILSQAAPRLGWASVPAATVFVECLGMSSAHKPPSRHEFRQHRVAEERAILEQLPEIECDSFILHWEFAPDSRTWTIKYGEQVLYREPARQEDYPRFELLARLLRARYGQRLRDLVPVSTPDADFYLYGDYLGSVARVEAARQRNFGALSARRDPED